MDRWVFLYPPSSTSLPFDLQRNGTARTKRHEKGSGTHSYASRSRKDSVHARRSNSSFPDPISRSSHPTPARVPSFRPDFPAGSECSRSCTCVTIRASIRMAWFRMRWKLPCIAGFETAFDVGKKHLFTERWETRCTRVPKRKAREEPRTRLHFAKGTTSSCSWTKEARVGTVCEEGWNLVEASDRNVSIPKLSVGVDEPSPSINQKKKSWLHGQARKGDGCEA